MQIYKTFLIKKPSPESQISIHIQLFTSQI